MNRNRMFIAAAAGAAMWAGGAQGAEAPATTVTLLTYNLHICVPMGGQIGATRTGASEVDSQGAVIASARPDIVALQEVDSEFGLALPEARRRSSMLPVPRMLSHRTGLSYVFGSAQDDVRYPSDNAGYLEWGDGNRWTNNGAEHGEVGNALLSRFPLRGKPESVALPMREGKERRQCIRAEILLPSTEGERAAAVYATHLQHDSAGSRAEQMKAILDRAAVDVAAGMLVFILGDLNHPADAPQGQGDGSVLADPCAQAREAGFHDLHALHAAAAKTPPAPTFPADAPRSRIDYIYCSEALRVLDAEAIATTASDHLPVRVVVELSPK